MLDFNHETPAWLNKMSTKMVFFFSYYIHARPRIIGAYSLHIKEARDLEGIDKYRYYIVSNVHLESS